MTMSQEIQLGRLRIICSHHHLRRRGKKLAEGFKLVLDSSEVRITESSVAQFFQSLSSVRISLSGWLRITRAKGLLS